MMRLTPECIPCTLQMITGVCTDILDHRGVEGVIKQILASPELAAYDWDRPSPLLVADLWPYVTSATGSPDPLLEIKGRQNQAALALLPQARQYVEASSEPLEAAVKVAAAGNTIDVMVDAAAGPADDLLDSLAGLALPADSLSELRERLAGARTLAYLTDNCGEVIFDRLLLEQLLQLTPARIMVVTHTLPIANDALEEDAWTAGLHELAQVVPGGTTAPLPGNLVARMTGEAQAFVERADLILAKGVANYELLTWEGALEGRLVSVLHAKCGPVCRELGALRGALVLTFR